MIPRPRWRNIVSCIQHRDVGYPEQLYDIWVRCYNLNNVASTALKIINLHYMGFEDRDRPGKGLFKTIREIAAVDLSIKFRLRSGETVELLTEGMAIEGETITGKLFGTKNETSLQINDIMDIEP